MTAERREISLKGAESLGPVNGSLGMEGPLTQAMRAAGHNPDADGPSFASIIRTPAPGMK